MLVNADFSRRAIVAPHQYEWIASPQGGVERVMLDRLGGEKARATSIVRYAAASYFPQHEHPGGEEILVLSGTFMEGDVRYPAGWYLRNPPGSAHRPSSEDGAIIFVKLWQMPAYESRTVHIDTRAPSSWMHQDGRDICPLFSAIYEKVCMLRLKPGQRLFASPIDSAELLVVAGELWADEAQQYGAGSWMRLPSSDYSELVAGDSGVTVYLKTGHLAGLTAGSRPC